MSMKGVIKSFFGNSRQYVVSGATNNPGKFGFKIMRWYLKHELPVVPLNPTSNEIMNITVVPNITELMEKFRDKKDTKDHKFSDKDGLSISFLTPPKVTLATLMEIANFSGFTSLIKGLWFQPGSYDYEVLEFAEKIGLIEIVVHEDECILVRGEEGLYSANL